MAKNDKKNPFGDFTKIVKLGTSRQNLKPVNPNLTFEQHLSQAIQEGYALLEEEAKNPKNSVKAPLKSDSVKLEDKLGEMSKNAYVKARAEVLRKMSPEARAIIEKMSAGELTKDSRWDTFCKAVNIKGEQIYLSSQKN